MRPARVWSCHCGCPRCSCPCYLELPGNVTGQSSPESEGCCGKACMHLCTCDGVSVPYRLGPGTLELQRCIFAYLVVQHRPCPCDSSKACGEGLSLQEPSLVSSRLVDTRLVNTLPLRAEHLSVRSGWLIRVVSGFSFFDSRAVSALKGQYARLAV